MSAARPSNQLFTDAASPGAAPASWQLPGLSRFGQEPPVGAPTRLSR
jgi:hypothetical protein